MSDDIANAAPLGLAAFALTTFALSVHNAGHAVLHSFWPWAVFYGGIAQFAAGMWEFKRGSTFAATAFSSYGMFWMGLASAVTLLDYGLISSAAFLSIEKVFLTAWTIFTFYMWVGTFRINWGLVGVFTTLEITFVFLTLGTLFDVSILGTLGGWFGIITALVAWYVSGAEVLQETWGKEVLPLGPIE